MHKVIVAIIFLSGWLGALQDEQNQSFIVEIVADNIELRSEIAEIIHIDSIKNNKIFSVVSKNDLNVLEDRFSEFIISASIMDDEVISYYGEMTGIIDFPRADAAFHTYEEMLAELRRLASSYPHLSSLFSIGKSVEGKDLWALKIGADNQKQNDDKPAIAYMGTHHAREHVSTEMPILYAKYLLENYLTDVRIKELVDRLDIYLIPMVNPDGAMHDIDGQRYKYWRKNRRQNHNNTFGVDLNRNYGYGWGTGGSSTNPSSDVYMGPQAFSEPETKAIRDFFLARPNISTALSFHTFSELILYPWGGLDSGVGGQDQLIFEKMARDMASMNNYKPMQSSGLYIASGDTCDWLYGELKVYCFTFELSPSSMWGGGFYPGASIIGQVFDDNLEPMLYMADLADDPSRVLTR